MVGNTKLELRGEDKDEVEIWKLLVIRYVKCRRRVYREEPGYKPW